MIRFVVAARTTVLVTAWLIGAPLLLTAVTGPPVPEHWPTAEQIHAWLDDPHHPAHQEATARILAWLVWAITAAAISTVLTTSLRRLPWAAFTRYLPPPVQGVTAAMLGTAAITTSAAPAAAATTPVAVTATALDIPQRPDTAAGTAVAPESVPADAAAGRHAGARRPPVYTVARGDWMVDVAQRFLGDADRYPDIARLNPHWERRDHRFPDHWQAGWTIVLPRDARDHGTRPHATGHLTPPPPATQLPSNDTRPGPRTLPAPSTAGPSPITPATSAPATRAASDGPTGDHRASISPATTHASPASTAPPRPRESEPPATGTPEQTGVDLPGGWVGLPLAAALAAATAMVWRRRRHRYTPTPITSDHLHDADLLPPLAAMTRIRTRLRRPSPDILDEHPMPTVREYQVAAVKPALPSTGPSGSELAGAAALPLSTGLGLTGDGALDAARGLLVSTLASGRDDDPDAKGRAIIPAATLATLLGAPAADLGHIDRLTVTTSDADAITQLEEEIIRRSRLLGDAQVADVHTLRDTNVHAEPLPQLLLITAIPDKAFTNRLATAVRLGHHVDIGAALIGDWPTGTTLTVAPDGTTGNHDTPRLAVLDTTATTETLSMLHEAHGTIDHPARLQPPKQPHLPATVPAEPGIVEPDTRHADDIAPPAIPPLAPAGRLPVAVRVLGRPAVLDHNGQPSTGIRTKALELLVYLAVNRHGADLSDIMEALFPDATLRRAGERLSTVVADLRKHIRQAAAPASPCAETAQPRKQRLEPIPNTGSRYHLDPAIVRVDWWTVLDHYEATATASNDDQRLAHASAALDAAGGALAEGAEYDWIDTDREVVRRHRVQLLAHAAALQADTDPHRSWVLLEQACQLDSLSEALTCTTMHAAAALGDADAIRHRLTTLHNALDSHGIERSEHTESLASELLSRIHPPPHE
ncbi:LysM peptidoglycan-binding domain-containing protein [Jidongwangia harbinensis]|uniref:LysM peptidoglycan-binding domain-containing protein n=1 Tax=Jidongwangia harbinensis TaxID=2878561 RepID=UPI001CD9246F|nr:hypothetical protein [Jidongwangia harbinensis]MCA2216304.1 hypothetical protein [Jidongwangia harbinensis]MCA2217039.1 hypothetical protein [Jidongwangia harbinensis]